MSRTHPSCLVAFVIAGLILPSVVAFLVTPQYSTITLNDRPRNQISDGFSASRFGLHYGSQVEPPKKRKNSHVFSPVWAVAIPSLSTLRELALPLKTIFLSNEWEVNLIKNALVLFCARFVVSTYVDFRKQRNLDKVFRRQRAFDKSKLPRLALATAMVAGAVLWLDSVFVFPEYVINISKNAFFIWVAMKTIPLLLSAISTKLSKAFAVRQKPLRTSMISQKTTKESMVPKPEKELPHVEMVKPDEEINGESVSVEPDEEEPNKSVDPEGTDQVEYVEPIAEQQPTKLEKKEKTKNENIPEKVAQGVAGGFALLSDLQESLAEFQSKTIPEFFDSPEETQDKLNALNQKILEFFKDGDDRKEDSS